MPQSAVGRASHREFQLLEILRRQGGSARNSEIAHAMDVSEETVRRLARGLERSGKVERLHGGTVLAGAEPAFFDRIAQNPDAKRRIAAAVACEVADGICLFLDVGSTTSFVAEALRGHTRLQVVTNSLHVAQVLANHNGNRVVLTGGELGGDERGTYGPRALEAMRHYAFDMAVLSANAVSERHGFLVFNPAEAEIASLAVKCARRAVMAVDYEKFARNAPLVSCPPDDIAALITDRPPPEGLAAALARWRVAVTLAGGDT
ncbi:Glycerol-3-phosphate regulon repressor [Defluviimonas aquaemixtae]|uniref:Glycerol-3-phosphate regulon repressor n=1 Tax=Albidovulum aquaemixtae TaxID=1542388 RepID=A0A2R8B666_9RHOB|nr:DeoR/GlpR family DNA-binding transcription regulator [Defluviimonas aquaemixtae]SPH18128.1 Glycerol-3-phosphate regulon repressor [Defluviimonas aquaemixtae]